MGRKHGAFTALDPRRYRMKSELAALCRVRLWSVNGRRIDGDDRAKISQHASVLAFQKEQHTTRLVLRSTKFLHQPFCQIIVRNVGPNGEQRIMKKKHLMFFIGLITGMLGFIFDVRATSLIDGPDQYVGKAPSYSSQKPNKDSFFSRPGALRALVDQLKVWPINHVIEVCFFPKYQQRRTFVVEAMRNWEKNAFLSFDVGSPPEFRECTPLSKSDVRVGFENTGSWSYVGTDAATLTKTGQPTMNIGSFYGSSASELTDFQKKRLSATALHEVGHAVGLQHEHQSPKSECEKEINWKKAYRQLGGPPNNWSQTEVDHNLRPALVGTRARATSYDRKSIMHYALPHWLFKNGKRSSCFVREVFEISQGDKDAIRLAYPKTKVARERFLSGVGNKITSEIQTSGLTKAEAEKLINLATEIVKRADPRSGFSINLKNISFSSSASQKSGDVNVRGSCNTIVSGVNDSQITISGNNDCQQ